MKADNKLIEKVLDLELIFIENVILSNKPVPDRKELIHFIKNNISE